MDFQDGKANGDGHIHILHGDAQGRGELIALHPHVLEAIEDGNGAEHAADHMDEDFYRLPRHGRQEAVEQGHGDMAPVFIDDARAEEGGPDQQIAAQLLAPGQGREEDTAEDLKPRDEHHRRQDDHASAAADLVQDIAYFMDGSCKWHRPSLSVRTAPPGCG